MSRPQMDLFSVPRARRTDPETSHAAAQSVSNLTQTQQGIYFVLKHRGSRTDEEIEAKYGEVRERFDFPLASPQGLRSRRAELVALGWVKDSGVTRPTKYGNDSVVWEAT